MVRFFFSIAILSLLCGCAPNLVGARWENNASPTPPKDTPFDSFVFLIDGDTINASEGLRMAYAKMLEGALPANENCQLNIKVKGTVEESFASWWYLGVIVFLPLWPAMPRETDMELFMDAGLFCDGQLVQQITLTEEEHPRLFWYGPYRNSEIQASADMMHIKLMKRLRSAIQQDVPVDTGMSSDF